MVDYNGAVWSPNNNFISHTGKKSFIILHGTAGGSSAEAIAEYYRNTEGGPNPVSSHYVVGQDGHVIQTVAEANGAYANGGVTNPDWLGNPNYYTISIEHVKSSTDNSDPLTPAQQEASFALIKDICTRNGIGMYEADDETGITGHFSIDPVNRNRCPGTFPWERLWAFLQGGNTMSGIPANWSDDGQTLTAPNGHKVVRGFRNYILNHTWDTNNQPLEEEHGADPAQLHRLDLGGGTRQCFRDGVLWWTSQTGVVNERYLGLELVATYSEIEKTKADLATALSQVNKLQSENNALKDKILTLNTIMDAQQQTKDLQAIAAIAEKY
jgi:N-acetyl-anhydromuramyl-L-alanine amidase AmpD